MADVVAVPPPPIPPPPQQHLFAIPTIPSYNISLNLTSILSLLPSSSFLTRSGLFRSIRRKWWESVADMHGEVVPVPLTMTSVLSESGTMDLNGGRETGAVGGTLVDIASWPSEAMLEAVVNEAAPGAPTAVGLSGGSLSSSSVPPPPPGYPGPWGFFASGYMLGLLLVAVFLHRIQNIIVPSRIPTRRGAHQRRFGRRIQRMSVLGAMWDSVFPLDLTKTTTRLMIHLPSLYFLSKVLLIWGVLILQTSQLYPADAQFAWVQRLGAWVEAKEMTDVCWKTFLAVCAGFAVEGFVKSLDGVEAGFPIGSNMNPNTSPFNIVGYAFLLHLYASPFAHSAAVVYREGVRVPSRPDKHAVITVAIPLLQLTMFHALSVSKRFSTHRLLPTTLSSILSLTHFHGALLSYFYGNEWYNIWKHPTATTTSGPGPSGARLLTTYPILNYIPNIFETLLILTILLTIVLNVLVQLVIRGRVDRIFSGLGIRGSASSTLWDLTNELDHDQDAQQDNGAQQHLEGGSGGGIWELIRSLPYDEDFGVLLLRIGTASLEATGLRGWSNEVAPVQARVDRLVRRRRAAIEGAKREYGSVRMGRVGAGGVQAGVREDVGATEPSGSRHGEGDMRRRRGGREQRLVAFRGLDNEVRHVDLGTASGHEVGEGLWWRWLRALGKYVEALWAAFRGLLRVIYARLVRNVKDTRRRRARGERRTRERGVKAGSGSVGKKYTLIEDGEDSSGESTENEREVYERFLRGEGISDDDEEYRDEDDEGVGHREEEEDEQESEREGEFGSDEEREAFGLFSDILRNGVAGDVSTGGSGGGAVVLAHLMDQSPMTRRRWQSLSSPDTRSSALRRRRHTTPGQWSHDDDSDDGDMQVDPFAGPSSSSSSNANMGKAHEIAARSVCVICTSEARDVICWPCRCLAMCDGCREALAARSAPVKHRCPCCRGAVEGYSRIYIP